MRLCTSCAWIFLRGVIRWTLEFMCVARLRKRRDTLINYPKGSYHRIPAKNRHALMNIVTVQRSDHARPYSQLKTLLRLVVIASYCDLYPNFLRTIFNAFDVIGSTDKKSWPSIFSDEMSQPRAFSYRVSEVFLE